MNIKRIANGKYEVMANGVMYCVYKSEGLWWAKDQSTMQVCDAATTKAELFRSMEAA